MTIHCGDCREVLPTFGAESFDACVTDPPYGLEFMGKDWDHGIPGVPFWEAVKRVLKPGAHLLAFGGTRTHHRLMCAIEDAGFEIRDTVCWLYGTGFPKSLDVSKAIDKAAGAEREVVGTKLGQPGYSLAPDKGRGTYSPDGRDSEVECAVTSPATDAARQWDGWGTALKPAWEPIVLARKPLTGTVAANVQEHGTGALNIDGCRIEADDIDTSRMQRQHEDTAGMKGLVTQDSRQTTNRPHTTLRAAGLRTWCWTGKPRRCWTSRAGRRRRGRASHAKVNPATVGA